MPKATGIASETFTGVVSMSVPVTGSVDVESLDQTGAVLAQLATGTSDATGAFTVSTATPTGWGRVCASGAFADPTTGLALQTVDEMCTLFDFSNVPAQIVISPESHLAATLATCRARRSSVDIGAAFATAKADLNALFACAVSPPVDVVDASPINVTVGARVAGSSAQTYAGLIAAGLSQESASISQSLGYVPGSTLTISQLLTALDQDITNDCVFDGKDNGAPIVVQGYTLTSQALRSGVFGLAEGIADFLRSSANKTGLALSDVQSLVGCMSAMPANALFPDSGTTFVLSPAPQITARTPDITNLASATHSTSVTVAGTIVTDVGSPITEITFADSGTTCSATEQSCQTGSSCVSGHCSIAPTIQTPGATYSQTVTVPCNVTTVIVVTATNASGLSTVVNVPVECDNQPPNPPQLTSYLFWQANNVAAKYTADGSAVTYAPCTAADAPNCTVAPEADTSKIFNSGSPTLNVFFNHLDYMGPTSAALDIPILAFTVVDQASGTCSSSPCNTPSGQLLVEYSYQAVDSTSCAQYTQQPACVADAWCVWTAATSTCSALWKTVAPVTVPTSGSDPAQYKLPIAYQTLGVALVQQAVGALQTVWVRVTDLAGNSSVAVPYQFQIQPFSPPAWVGSCTMNGPFSPASLPAFYESAPISVMSATMKFELASSTTTSGCTDDSQCFGGSSCAAGHCALKATSMVPTVALTQAGGITVRSGPTIQGTISTIGEWGVVAAACPTATGLAHEYCDSGVCVLGVCWFVGMPIGSCNNTCLTGQCPGSDPCGESACLSGSCCWDPTGGCPTPTEVPASCTASSACSNEYDGSAFSPKNLTLMSPITATTMTLSGNAIYPSVLGKTNSLSVSTGCKPGQVGCVAQPFEINGVAYNWPTSGATLSARCDFCGGKTAGITPSGKYFLPCSAVDQAAGDNECALSADFGGGNVEWYDVYGIWNSGDGLHPFFGVPYVQQFTLAVSPIESTPTPLQFVEAGIPAMTVAVDTDSSCKSNMSATLQGL